MRADLNSWISYLPYFWKPVVVRMFFLGFSAGLPLLLIFSSLSLWLREAGVDRSAVTYFSWAALGYSFKFIWAPLVGSMPIPLLTDKLGQRRSWLIISQLAIMLSIAAMALTDPIASDHGLTIMAIAAVALGFSSATQDIVIDAYRIETGSSKVQALMSSMYITGYRVGLIVAGAGALFLADYLGSSTNEYNYSAWRTTYLVMSALMSIGIITTLIIPEPDKKTLDEDHLFTYRDHMALLMTFVLAIIGFIAVFYFSSEYTLTIKSILSATLHNNEFASIFTEGIRLALGIGVAYLIARLLMVSSLTNADLVNSFYISPIQDFFQRYSGRQILLLLALISLYRISDIVLGVISNVFYSDMGFSKTDIATVVKTFGLMMALVGGFLGGLIALRLGILPALFLGALLSSLTNLLFLLLASGSPNIEMLYLVIAADNLSAGIATAAFVAFLSSLVNISFTAMQYAIFSSTMTLLPKILGGYSGSMVTALGYPNFFIITFLLGLPVLVVIIMLNLDRTFTATETDNTKEDASATS
jgi:PAT family beta-lactamase induction signal transducer AmpG